MRFFVLRCEIGRGRIFGGEAWWLPGFVLVLFCLQSVRSGPLATVACCARTSTSGVQGWTNVSESIATDDG